MYLPSPQCTWDVTFSNHPSTGMIGDLRKRGLGMNISKERLMMTCHAYLTDFAEFAHAYFCYNKELTRAKRRIVTHGITDAKDEREYSNSLEKTVNYAAAKLFQLNGLCKHAYGEGFVLSDHPIVDNKEKEDMILFAADCILYGTNDKAIKEAK